MSENWDAQLDNCLMNATSLQAAAPYPQSHDEFQEQVFAWLAIADQWSHRQTNELEYEKWRSGKEIADDEGGFVFELDPGVVL